MSESHAGFHDLRITRARVSIITIAREERLNALSCDVLSQIRTVLAELENDPEVCAVVLTGAGTRAFAAGADITELAAVTEREHGIALSAHGQTVFSQFGECALPIIAALNGTALGGGLELAMACDLRVAVPQARLGMPEATLGLLPGFGGTQALAALIGPSRAMHMLFTAEPITAEEAFRIGLVDLIADDGDALTAACAIAERIARHPRSAIAAAKSALRTGLDLGLEAGLDRERELFGRALVGQDGRAGLAAFLSRRAVS